MCLSVFLLGSRKVGVEVRNRKRVGVQGADGIYKRDEGYGRVGRQKKGAEDGSCGEGKKRKREKKVEREFKRSEVK